MNTSAWVGVNLEALLRGLPGSYGRESLEHSSTLRDKWGGISLDGVVCKQCDHGTPTTFSLQFWRLVQRLHDHTILFCLLAQCAQFAQSRRLRSDNFKSGMNTLKADRYFLRDTERAPKVQISFDRYLNPFDRYSHGRGNHLAGDLRAGRQSSQ